MDIQDNGDLNNEKSKVQFNNKEQINAMRFETNQDTKIRRTRSQNDHQVRKMLLPGTKLPNSLDNQNNHLFKYNYARETKGMGFIIFVVVVYVVLSLIYGTAFAAVQQGQKYFNSCVLISYRMIFGFLTCLIIFGFRLLFEKDYKKKIMELYQANKIPFKYLALIGFLFHAVMQDMAAISVQWLPSAAAQITQPISSVTVAIISHFVLPGNEFNRYKFLTLLFAIVGVVLNAVPSFLHTSTSSETKNVTIGYIILIIAVIIQGVAMTLMDWKTPNIDVTLAAVVQVGSAAVCCVIFSLIYDTAKVFGQQSANAKPEGWLWVMLVGVLATGVAGHGYNYLTNSIGSLYASFIIFGQILVGIIVGVAFCHEWKGFRWWEILMCIIGVIFLGLAIGLGFLEKNMTQEQSENEDTVLNDINESEY